MPNRWVPKIQTLEDKLRIQWADIEAGQWTPPMRDTATPQDSTWTPAMRATETNVGQAWMPQTTQPVAQPISPPMPQVGQEQMIPQPVMEEPSKWWELPKEWTETGMEKVGEGISKVPILPEVLKFAEPAFKWIHEELEKPFAAIVTSPFSPEVAWKSGESWKQHQVRKYDAWEAPTYIKGVAEFAMPLWWVPWFAWAGKGARALGFGTITTRKAMTEIAKAGGKLTTVSERGLPTSELLDNVLFRTNRLQSAMKGVPIINKIVERVGGVGAFITRKEAGRISGLVKSGAELVGDDVVTRTRMELVKSGFISDMRNGIKSLHVPKLQVLEPSGGVAKLLGMDAKGVVSNIVDNTGTSQYLYDVLEGAMKNPDNYTFLTKESRVYVNTLKEILDDVYKMAAKEGVRKVPKEPYLHRIVKGKAGIEGYEASEYGSLFEKSRKHLLQKQGVEQQFPVDYGLNINESVSSTIDHYVKAIARKRFEKEVGKLGKTAKQRFVEAYPEEASKIVSLSSTLLSTKYAEQALSRLNSYAGKRLPSSVITKIRNELPQVGAKIDNALLLSPVDVNTIITKLSGELKTALKLSPSEVNATIKQINYIASAFKKEVDIGKIMYGEIDDAVRYVSNKAGAKADIVEQVYKEAYNLKRKAVNEAIKSVRNDLKGLSDGAKLQLSPLRSVRNSYLKRYEGKQILGEGLAKFRSHPVFKDTIFPKEVVKATEKLLDDNSQRWLKDVANVSGTSRMLTAAMDTSAPFIQGMTAWGNNPVAWADAVYQMFKFVAQPRNLYKYLSNSEVMATRMERIMAGGSSSTFEFFQALAPLQRVAGKVPIIGKQFDRLVGATYGRAEAAFTGFGEVARNNLWKAMRHKTLKDGVVSPELAMDLTRTLDRMTGVMSTEALAIGRTQQDFENAFVFFAPRYTRAGLTFVSDTLRGGMAGAEARKSIAAMMAGGTAMYYGACKALGQQPNFNPSSGRFMTIQVGDSHIGIGGIMIALGRLGYDVAVTTIEDPINLVKPISEGHLNRWDNPFIRFLYARTSPVTSGAVSTLLEQANYFGEPFENVGDWGKFMLDKVTPIAAQELTEYAVGDRPTPPSLAAVAAEFGGLRVFPKSQWELLDEQRDEVALREYQQPYDTLNDLNKMRVDRNDAVRKLQGDVDAQTVTRGDKDSVAFVNWERERDYARTVYEESVWNLQRAYDGGAIDGIKFREGLQDAGYGLGTTYEHIINQPEYKDVREILAKPRKVGDKSIEDIAYAQYMDMMFSGKLDDEYGIFDYDKYNAFIDEFISRYGEEVYQYVQDTKKERDTDMPPLYKEYQVAKEVMKPYWAVQNKIETMFGKLYAESRGGQRLITKMRQQLRVQNPAMEKYYQMFYTQQ